MTDLQDEILAMLTAHAPDGVEICDFFACEKIGGQFSRERIRKTLGTMRRALLIHPARIGPLRVFWRLGEDPRGLAIEMDDNARGAAVTRPVKTQPRPGVTRVGMWHVRAGEKPSKPPATGIKSGMGAMEFL